MPAATTNEAQQTLKGIAWMVLTGFLFTGVTGIVRHLGSDMPAVEGAFIRYLIGTLLILPLLYPSLKTGISKEAVKIHAIRGFVHAFGVMLWFFAMARIPIAEVTAIGFTAPIFVTIGAAMFLGERLRIRRIAAVVAGFLGVLIIIRPGFHEIGAGQVAQLVAAPLFAASFIIAKKLTGRSSPVEIVAMLSLFCTMTLLPGAMLQWRTPTVEEVMWLGLTALVATSGHYTLTRALACAPITVTQPISFLQLVWAVVLGILVFGEPADPYVIIGGAVIISAITYISHREVQIARKQVTPPPGGAKI